MEYEICNRLIDIINKSVKTVWYFRQQYFYMGFGTLNQIITMLQSTIQDIVDDFGEGILSQMGLEILTSAQESQDEILIADILEGQLIPTLESLVQQIQLSMSVEDIDYLEANLLALSERGESNLVNVIKSVKPFSGCEYLAEFTASGQITICLHERGERYYVSGNNNPYRDAIHFVHGNIEDDFYQYILYGAGMFFEAQLLLEERPDAFVVVVEEDPYLLRMALTYREVTSLLLDERLSLVCDEFENYAGKLDSKDKCLLMRKPSLKHMRNVQFREALERFFLKSMTVKEQAYVLEKEFRLNIGSHNIIHSVDECENDFCGKTVYLVAGGPSLNETIGVLRNREKDAIVLCVGTAATKLKKENIVADYVIITDVADGMYDRIHGNVDEERTRLLYMISANAKAVQSFGGKKYAIFQRNFDLAEEYAIEHEFTLFSTGGSVSTTALDVCVRFGCKRLVCLGLDLAYTNNMTHASDTLGQRSVVTDVNTLMVESVSGEMIPTSMNLSSYHRWIENRIHGEKDVEFINISNGAYIEGMKNILTSRFTKGVIE